MILLTASLHVIAQESDAKEGGEVTYISGQNIYVRFESTQGINNGDTLFLQKNEQWIPALIVQHQSSISCLCIPLEGLIFRKGDQLQAKRKKEESSVLSTLETIFSEEVDENTLARSTPSINKEKDDAQKKKGSFSGNISASSYSNILNTEGYDSHRFRYRLSMKAANISGSKVSAETYLSFTHRLHEWDEVRSDLNSAMKVYSLALNYKFNPTTSIWAGRKINPNTANIGAVDGLQFQKEWDHFFVGAVAGTRPDFANYGFNPSLPEFGAYVGHKAILPNAYMQTSLAVFEQRNKWNTDRRFLYFQHSNTLFKKLNLFSSFELDLYKLEEGVAQNALSLTSMYLSMSYRFSSKLSIHTSYDNRRNVIYYETFRNYADEILQQANRQGIRFRINIRPIKYMNIGVSAGTRYKKEDPQASNNLNTYISYSNMPGIKGSLNLSGNLIENAFLTGTVFGLRYSRDLLPGKLSFSTKYRKVSFNYSYMESQLNQQIAELELSSRIKKTINLSLNYEATFQQETTFNRLYLILRKNFK